MLEKQRPEEKKRRKIGTVRNLKTAMTARLHSKPRTEGQEYLEMWTLKRDLARWVQTQEQAAESIEGIGEAMAKVVLPEGEALNHKPGAPPVSRTPPRKTIEFRSRAGRQPRT